MNELVKVQAGFKGCKTSVLVLFLGTLKLTVDIVTFTGCRLVKMYLFI